MKSKSVLFISIALMSIMLVVPVLGLPTIPGVPGNVTLPDIPPIPSGFNRVNVSSTPIIVLGRVLRNMTVNQMPLMVMSQEKLQFLIDNSNGTVLRNLDLDVWNNRSTEFRMSINRSLPHGVLPPVGSVGEFMYVSTNLTEPLMAQFMVQLNQSQLGGAESQMIRELYTWSMHNGTHWVDLRTETDANGTVTVSPSFEPAVNNIMALRQVVFTPSFRRVAIRLSNEADHLISSSGLGEDAANMVIAGKNYVLQNSLTTLALRSSGPGLELYLRENQKKVENLFSLQVDSSNKLQLQVNNTDKVPSGLPLPENGIGYYLEIEANNTINQAELGSYMNQTQLREIFGPQVNRSRLSWAFWNGAEWEPIRSMINEGGFLKTNTTHFSTWSIIEVEEEIIPDANDSIEISGESDEPEVPEPKGGIPMPPMFTFVGLIAVTVIFVYNRRS